MCVPLGIATVCMAEQTLHNVERNPLVNEEASKRMPQIM